MAHSVLRRQSPASDIDPDETQTFEMSIPVLPPAAIEILRQQAVLYGYQDPDHDHDYHGLRIPAGTRHHCTFMPFGE